MASDNLQQKTFNGMTWTFAKNLSLQLFGFIQGIILARLLQPSDYGLIAMTQIFFAISSIFIDSGFTSALIKNKDRTELDYSTVYVTNVCLTLFFAILLYCIAPLIATFYKESLLTKIVRANALLMVLNSFNATQGTRMSINLQFKQKSIISIIVNITVGITCIVLAFCGYGVWSLIYPNYLAPFLYLVLYWRYQHWYPRVNFSWSVWKSYFSYGSKILASSLIKTTYLNLYPIIIGKKYSSSELGFYSKAKSYSVLPASTFEGMISSVTFPVLSSVQNNDLRLKEVYRRLIRVSSYCLFPIMIGLCAVAKPIIIVLLTEKWAESIALLRVLCLDMMWYSVSDLNQNLLQVKGRSDLVLKLMIAKISISLLILFITMRYSVFIMCCGQVVSAIIFVLINSHYSGKLINLSLKEQIYDIIPSLTLSVIMGIIVYCFIGLFSNLTVQLFVGITFGAILYYLLSVLVKSQDLEYLKMLLKNNVLTRFR